MLRPAAALALALPAALTLAAPPLHAGPPRPPRPQARRAASDPAASDLLRRMLQAENSLALAGDQITVVSRGGLDLSSEQRVQRDGARALRIDYVRPARLAGEQIVDNGRFFCHFFPSRDTLELSPSRLGTLRVRVPEVIRQVRAGRLLARPAGQGMVAGRACLIVQVSAPTPGPMRRFWIDPTNGAQLRIEQYDSAGRLLSVSYYTEVTYRPAFSRATFRLPPAGGRVVATGFPAPTLSLDQMRAQAGFAVPLPSFLPPGFRFSGGAVSDGRRGRVAEMRFTGGATVLSLFETPDAGPQAGPHVSRPRRGVVSGSLAGVKAVLIGNLPDAGLQRILGSLR